MSDSITVHPHSVRRCNSSSVRGELCPYVLSIKDDIQEISDEIKKRNQQLSYLLKPSSFSAPEFKI